MHTTTAESQRALRKRSFFVFISRLSLLSTFCCSAGDSEFLGTFYHFATPLVVNSKELKLKKKGTPLSERAFGDNEIPLRVFYGAHVLVAASQ